MAVYFVQHAKSLPKELDPQRGLSREGITETQRIAEVAAHYGVKVSSILHSGKLRAAQTADIFAEALKPHAGVRTINGIDPLDDVVPFAHRMDLSREDMIIGHLPFLEKLLAFLITGKPSPPVFRMQNSGIVCLDHYPETTQVVIRWALMPNIG